MTASGEAGGLQLYHIWSSCAVSSPRGLKGAFGLPDRLVQIRHPAFKVAVVEGSAFDWRERGKGRGAAKTSDPRAPRRSGPPCPTAWRAKRPKSQERRSACQYVSPRGNCGGARPRRARPEAMPVPNQAGRRGDRRTRRPKSPAEVRCGYRARFKVGKVVRVVRLAGSAPLLARRRP